MDDIVQPLRDQQSRGGTRHFWRSVEQLSDDREFRKFLEAEFPAAVTTVFDQVGRRQFLQLMGASLALAGISACTHQPEERIVPQVRAPENIIPGKPLYFATAMAMGSDAIGLLVESHMGRPTKIEGNPDHPGSLGAADVFAQSAVLTLYDPDRSGVVRSAGEIRPWSAFASHAAQIVAAQQQRGGAGLRLLTGTVVSPTLAAQIRALLEKLPQAKWYQWEPVNDDNVLAGARLAFGQPALPSYRLEQAKVIVALDADFLTFGPQRLRLARELAARRRQNDPGQFNRLYVAEPSPTITGAKADNRLAVSAAEIARVAVALAQRLGAGGGGTQPGDAAETAWVDAVAADLQANRGASLVMAGPTQPAEVHALVNAINDRLGNSGKTVQYGRGAAEEPAMQLDGLRELVRDMAAGQVEALYVLGTNPMLTAPADLDFAGAFAKVPLRVHAGLYQDETAHQSHWHIPEAHFLESWSDVRAADGTVSIVQPLILPLYEGKSLHEIVAALHGEGTANSHDIVRAHWRATRGGGADEAAFDTQWRRWLHDGVIGGTAFEPLTLQGADINALPPAVAAAGEGDSFELVFRPDPHVYDGRFANNGWLQELPKPVSKLTWDNALLIAPEAAKQLGVGNGDVVEIQHGERKLNAAVWIQPGQARRSLTLHLGYGRSRGGTLAIGRGFNAYALRTSDGMGHLGAVRLRPTGDEYLLVSSQDHGSMEGRDLLRVQTVGAHEPHHDGGAHGGHDDRPPSLYPDYKYEGNQWGMAIDLSSCIGCNACTIACQAENNIPVVGKEEVGNGREMHWIRVDRYFEGEAEDPGIHFQPVPCMHCENAPCEIVCPANATMHSNEGLNEMIYNRCVGTRYCANNCPYKVRRFNFFLYNDWDSESLKLQRNPDVTVRSRGVMEKCTYCVQRINVVRIEAKKAGRAIADGEIVPACQQTCPTEAIVFGNVHDPASRVSKLKKEQRNYGMLTELNTRPRTTYLADLRNPNPALAGGDKNHKA
ncbi:MAG TPA: TAT-variant-translocated molybdopterin oxidoreductase [Terriglobales bacterium]|nr:TAT-variant-translocated molybdopterin oxidoreductase [Terriglobales bacterium]